MREQVISRIYDTKLIAIVRGVGGEVILPLTEALLRGGVSMVEVTFDQRAPESFPATAAAIAAARGHFGADALVGAGTVVTEAQLALARDAGAAYIVSPNTDPAIIARTRAMGLVSLPGAMTPTECLAAHQAGADFVKLFPAGDLGPGYLRALAAPLGHVRFLAVGGVTPENIPAFLSWGAVGFGVGGNLVDKKLIETGAYGAITERAKAFVRAVGRKAEP